MTFLSKGKRRLIVVHLKAIVLINQQVMGQHGSSYFHGTQIELYG